MHGEDAALSRKTRPAAQPAASVAVRMFSLPLPPEMLGMSGGFPLRLGLYKVIPRLKGKGWIPNGCILTNRPPARTGAAGSG